jgi:hypothetical protein
MLGVRDQKFWGFLFFHPIDGIKSLSSASIVVKNQTFGAALTNLKKKFNGPWQFFENHGMPCLIKV